MKPPQTAHQARRLYPEDLSVLERRGRLNDASRRRLELCLASSEAFRALHALGHRFDEIPDNLPGDNVLLQRLASRALQRFEGRPSYARLRGKVAWLTGAILLLGTLSAAAALWSRIELRFLPSAPSSVPQLRTSAPVRSSSKQRHSSVPVVSPVAAVAERGSLVANSTDVTVTTRIWPSQRVEALVRGADSSNASRVSEAPERSSPSEIFSAGNVARRAGDLARAVSLYHELKSRYPQSDEAQLAHMMLGRLELGRGNASQALLDYEGYLKGAPDGALVQEALHGKARALHLLGIKDEERLVWQELLRRFPMSAYSEAALEHLNEDH